MRLNHGPRTASCGSEPQTPEIQNHRPQSLPWSHVMLAPETKTQIQIHKYLLSTLPVPEIKMLLEGAQRLKPTGTNREGGS